MYTCNIFFHKTLQLYMYMYPRAPINIKLHCSKATSLLVATYLASGSSMSQEQGLASLGIRAAKIEHHDLTAWTGFPLGLMKLAAGYCNN